MCHPKICLFDRKNYFKLKAIKKHKCRKSSAFCASSQGINSPFIGDRLLPAQRHQKMQEQTLLHQCPPVQLPPHSLPLLKPKTTFFCPISLKTCCSLSKLLYNLEFSAIALSYCSFRFLLTDVSCMLRFSLVNLLLLLLRAPAENLRSLKFYFSCTCQRRRGSRN